MTGSTICRTAKAAMPYPTSARKTRLRFSSAIRCRYTGAPRGRREDTTQPRRSIPHSALQARAGVHARRMSLDGAALLSFCPSRPSLFGTRRLADPARLGGLDPAFFHNVLPQVPRVEPRLHRGEWLLVHWYAHSDGEAVRAITRVEADGDRLTRVRNYFYTPDVLGEICAELQVPFRSNGYRYWKPSREESFARSSSSRSSSAATAPSRDSGRGSITPSSTTCRSS